MSTFETAVEFDVDVEYTFSKGKKGTRDRYGVPEEPDSEDEIEITAVNISVAGKDGKPMPLNIYEWLTKEQLDTIEQDIWEHMDEANDE